MKSSQRIGQAVFMAAAMLAFAMPSAKNAQAQPTTTAIHAMLAVPVGNLVQSESAAKSKPARTGTDDEDPRPPYVEFGLGILSVSALLFVGLLIARRREAEAHARALDRVLNRLTKSQNDLVLKETELRQGQKMEAIGRLAGGIAHDFNNVLTVISACASLMEHSPDAEVHEPLENINKSVERASAMTRQLLAFSRKQVLQPRVVDLNKLLRELNKMLDRLIGEDIEMVATFEQDLWRIKADPGQIEQVAMNLVVNARDAMECGGTLSIATTNTRIASGFISADGSNVPAGDYVQLAVSDTGHGMDSTTLTKIFEPFFTTKPEGKGTGLGLSTVYGIVKQSDGAVCVRSTVGVGTVFEILLPRSLEAIVEPEPASTSQIATTGTILLVEDEDTVRQLTSIVLTNRGYRVLSASNADEGIAICREHDGTIDLLLTDVVMPGKSGAEVAAEAKLLRPSIRILYMSGYTDDMIGSHGVIDSTVKLIYKPFTPAALAEALIEAMDCPGVCEPEYPLPC